MDLRSLRYIVVLGRKLSYTKAAEELGLSQSALSRSIQAIEQRAGVRLFDRDRGGVHLTTIGRDFVERAAALLREADELDQVLRRAGTGAQGKIAFGMAPLPAAVLAPAALSEALASTPDLRSHVYVRSTEALLSLLTREEIEFLVCSEQQVPETAPVEATPLGMFPISLLVRAGHPLLAGGAARDQFPLIVSAPFERHAQDAAVGEPHIILEDHGALMRITEASDAVWLSSSFAAADEIVQGRIRELPSPPGRERQFPIVMCSLDRRSLSPAALRLRDQFRSRIRALCDRLPASTPGDDAAATATVSLDSPDVRAF
jgi:DNA-binding transcriptional LysR family regulator